LGESEKVRNEILGREGKWNCKAPFTSFRKKNPATVAPNSRNNRCKCTFWGSYKVGVADEVSQFAVFLVVIVRCKRCKGLGHNQRTCKGKTVAERMIPPGGNKVKRWGWCLCLYICYLIWLHMYKYMFVCMFIRQYPGWATWCTCCN